MTPPASPTESQVQKRTSVAVDAGAAAIVNPKSANGRTARAWPAIAAALEQALGRPLVIDQTARAGHAIELTAARLGEGFRTIIVIGGDGTVNEAVNGFFRANPHGADATLGIVPRGSGSDFWRSLSPTVEDRHAIDVIKRGAVRRIDVGRASFAGAGGEPLVRYFVNIASFGLGGAVADRANRSSKALGGMLSMLKATLLANVSYRKRRISLALDEHPPYPVKIINVAVGNGQYHGGRMRPCPRARLDDGYFDVTVIGDIGQIDMFWSFAKLYSGRVYEHPKVDFRRARHVRAWADGSTLLEIDGEALGRLPLEITLLPKALSVFAPAA